MISAQIRLASIIILHPLSDHIERQERACALDGVNEHLQNCLHEAEHLMCQLIRNMVLPWSIEFRVSREGAPSNLAKIGDP